MHTGDIIKWLRKKTGMTQEDLARHLNVTKSSVQKYENGMVKNLKLETIRELCLLFDAPPRYFIFPENLDIDQEDNLEMLKEQALFIIFVYSQLTQKGRERLFMYMKDFLEIEQYCIQDLSIYTQDYEALKRMLESYE